MGQEATCTLRYGDRTAVGRAHLDTAALDFRSDDGKLKLSLPFAEIKDLQSTARVLSFRHGRRWVAVELGLQAEAWYLKIRYPKTLIDKLGVRPDMRVSVLGVEDQAFWRALEERTDDIGRGRLRKESDFIFLGAGKRSALSRLSKLESKLKRNGAVWVVWPKGRQDITQSDVMAASKKYGLVDVKIVSFSEALSALKLMIPKARR